QDGIGNSRRRYLSARALQRFRMLTKSISSIRDGLFQGLPSRKTAFDIRKPDAKSTVGFFFHDRYIMRRHRFEISSHLRSSTPAGQLVDPTYKSRRQILFRMCHSDDLFPLGMPERVVITVHSIKHPSILFQHLDQLATVSLHIPVSEAA